MSCEYENLHKDVANERTNEHILTNAAAIHCKFNLIRLSVDTDTHTHSNTHLHKFPAAINTYINKTTNTESQMMSTGCVCCNSSSSSSSGGGGDDDDRIQILFLGNLYVVTNTHTHTSTRTNVRANIHGKNFGILIKCAVCSLYI